MLVAEPLQSMCVLLGGGDVAGGDAVGERVEGRGADRDRPYPRRAEPPVVMAPLAVPGNTAVLLRPSPS